MWREKRCDEIRGQGGRKEGGKAERKERKKGEMGERRYWKEGTDGRKG